MEVLVEMERAGVKIDAGIFKQLSKRLEKETVGIVKTIYELAGTEFNINSPKQLADILFVKLKLNPDKKDENGFSTNVDVLEELAHVHPLPAEILKYPDCCRNLNHIYRCPARNDQPEDRQAPYFIQPDCYRYRKAFEQRSQPPEYPDPHRAGQGNQAGIYSRIPAPASSQRTTLRSSSASWPI